MNKRKATDCKFIRESNSNPGYNKYIVTVKECDGTTSQVPAYGKDMQDALRPIVTGKLTISCFTLVHNLDD